MINHTINNYLIERQLGEGGMGIVYYAKHDRVDREVAIKVLHSNLFSNESIRQRFKNEANALVKLSHPNIVKIFDYVEQDNFACLIMEYIHGYTLDEYIATISGPLPSPKANAIICSVLDAVQYAHENKIYHRDIKPNNIMISEDGTNVRIMDFGIAKLTDSASFKATSANAQLGTPFYMSPEQVKGLSYTNQSDIYSLGVTLFEMVTGKCPYQEMSNLFELQNKIVNDPLPPTSTYYPEVSTRIQNAINIATNKDPEKRFKTCADFKAFLLGTGEEKYLLALNKKEHTKRSKLSLTFLMVFMVISVATGFYFVNSKTHPAKQPYPKQNIKIDLTQINLSKTDSIIKVFEKESFKIDDSNIKIIHSRIDSAKYILTDSAIKSICTPYFSAPVKENKVDTASSKKTQEKSENNKTVVKHKKEVRNNESNSGKGNKVKEIKENNDDRIFNGKTG